MVTINISEQLATKLDALASKTQQPVEDLIEQAIIKYSESLQPATKDTQQEWVYDANQDPLLLILQAAEELNLRSGRSDISQLSGETIAEEYAQYLIDLLNDNS